MDITKFSDFINLNNFSAMAVNLACKNSYYSNNLSQRLNISYYGIGTGLEQNYDQDIERSAHQQVPPWIRKYIDTHLLELHQIDLNTMGYSYNIDPNIRTKYHGLHFDSYTINDNTKVWTKNNIKWYEHLTSYSNDTIIRSIYDDINNEKYVIIDSFIQRDFFPTLQIGIEILTKLKNQYFSNNARRVFDFVRKYLIISPHGFANTDRIMDEMEWIKKDEKIPDIYQLPMLLLEGKLHTYTTNTAYEYKELRDYCHKLLRLIFNIPRDLSRRLPNQVSIYESILNNNFDFPRFYVGLYPFNTAILGFISNFFNYKNDIIAVYKILLTIKNILTTTNISFSVEEFKINESPYPLSNNLIEIIEILLSAAPVNLY